MPGSLPRYAWNWEEFSSVKVRCSAPSALDLETTEYQARQRIDCTTLRRRCQPLLLLLLLLLLQLVASPFLGICTSDPHCLNRLPELHTNTLSTEKETLPLA